MLFGLIRPFHSEERNYRQSNWEGQIVAYQFPEVSDTSTSLDELIGNTLTTIDL